MIQDLVVYAVFIGYAIGVLMTFGLLLTWVERKQAAVMSDRIGANRAYLRLPFTQIKLVWWGLFHGIADGVKMLLKEDFKPRTYDWYAYMVAPWVVFTPVLLVFAVIPFGGMLDPGRLFPSLAEWFGGRTYPMQIARLDAGLLMVFAFGGMTIIGAMLAGWSSSNKFALLGALRAGSQMISYELVMGLTVLGLILIYGTVDLFDIVGQQSGRVGGLPAWGIVFQPFAATLFLAAAIAENKRIPFDLPEAESELISGYFTEYSAMKMGLFMFAEFIEIAIIARAVHDAVPRRPEPALHERRRIRLPRRLRDPHEPRCRRGDPGDRVPRQGGAAVQLPDPDPLVAAALPLRPGAEVRVEVHAAARARQPGRHRRLDVGAPRLRTTLNKQTYVRRRYWNEPTMSWWERAYLFEILRGLAITGGVFMRNMGKWMTGRKGALTSYYPEETRPDYAAGNRGKHVLTQRPDGRPQCIACNMCATVCPAKVIEIEAAFDPDDPAHPKYPSRFEIDYSRCVFCGLCVEACPEDAIRMAKEVPDFPSPDRTDMWLGKEELLTWNPQRDVAKPYPPAGGTAG